MSEEPRFDWGGIIRSSAIIVGGAGALGFIIPLVATPLLSLYDTGIVAGNDIYRFVYWAAAWGLTVLQGSWMLRQVGDRIIDDMLVTSIISALGLVILKFIIWVVYVPEQPFTTLDAGGALLLVVVALIAARANKY